MGSVISLLIGIVVTFAVSRYYFQRSINKRLGVYGLLNSSVFSGIASDVRKELHFRFQDREVRELQQLVFLVSNDGEKAIRDVIEPLCLTIPADVEILDASVIHRRPEMLKVDLAIEQSKSNSSRIVFHFPVLNKREFFVVKLLLSGSLSLGSLAFGVLGEDLPRSLVVQPVPPAAIRDSGYSFEWVTALIASLVLGWLSWLVYCLLLLRNARPELFPYPWSSFHPSGGALLVFVPGALSVILLAVVAIALLTTAVFGWQRSWLSGPHFPLPKELQEAVFPYPLTAEATLKPSAWEDTIIPVKPDQSSPDNPNEVRK